MFAISHQFVTGHAARNTHTVCVAEFRLLMGVDRVPGTTVQAYCTHASHQPPAKPHQPSPCWPETMCASRYHGTWQYLRLPGPRPLLDCYKSSLEFPHVPFNRMAGLSGAGTPLVWIGILPLPIHVAPRVAI